MARAKKDAMAGEYCEALSEPSTAAEVAERLDQPIERVRKSIAILVNLRLVRELGDGRYQYVGAD